MKENENHNSCENSCSCHKHDERTLEHHEHEHEHHLDHGHAHHHEHCCGHEHEHERHHDSCCGHDHEHGHSHGCGCGCSHDHKHDEEDSKVIITRLIAGGVLFIGGLLFKFDYNILLFIAAYVILGYDVVINGIKSLFKNGIFSEHFLMTIASLGAFALGDYADGCAVMLLYQIGEFFCDSASEKSEKSIRELIDVKPEYANLVTESGTKKIKPEELRTGDIVTVSTGEKIPSDGVVIEGKTRLDTSSMTGESDYSLVNTGDEVISGTINCDSLIKVKITKPYSESGVSKVVKMLDEIDKNKSSSEKFITVFAKYYTPIVILLALLTFLVPTLIFGGSFRDWGYRALVFLVVSCPCALVISVPLAFYSANGCASKYGMLIKGSLAIEKLSKLKIVAFDKTGTLTVGSFRLEAIRCQGIKAEALETLAYAEYYSTHPLSDALLNEYKKAVGKDIDASRISDYTEIGGKGISVKIDGKSVLVGNEKIMRDNRIDFSPADSKFTVSYLAVDGKYVGYAEFTDGIKPEAKDAIDELKKMKITPALLSGDKMNSVKAVASALGIDEVHYELLPQDKVSIIEGFKSQGNVAFTGDGINDAPVISCSDVGIAMGLNGSDAAIEASDMVLLSDDISRIPLSVKISKRTMKIVMENIVFSIGIKVLIMVLGALGYAGLWLAVFGDVGVSIIAVINSLRAMKYNTEE